VHATLLEGDPLQAVATGILGGGAGGVNACDIACDITPA